MKSVWQGLVERKILRSPIRTSLASSNVSQIFMQRVYCYSVSCATSLNGSKVSTQRMSAMSGIMEALTDVGNIIIGVYNGTQTDEMADLVEKVSRRAHRDNLFDKVVKTSVPRKPDLKRIQGELADAWSFTMEEKSEAKRARILHDRIKMERKILVILQDLSWGLDLGKVGIPFGEDHRGCKILLTSTSEEILSNQMQAHKIFVA